MNCAVVLYIYNDQPRHHNKQNHHSFKVDNIYIYIYIRLLVPWKALTNDSKTYFLVNLFFWSLVDLFFVGRYSLGTSRLLFVLNVSRELFVLLVPQQLRSFQQPHDCSVTSTKIPNFWGQKKLHWNQDIRLCNNQVVAIG
jgi:hypothetical protein